MHTPRRIPLAALLQVLCIAAAAQTYEPTGAPAVDLATRADVAAATNAAAASAAALYVPLVGGYVLSDATAFGPTNESWGVGSTSVFGTSGSSLYALSHSGLTWSDAYVSAALSPDDRTMVWTDILGMYSSWSWPVSGYRTEMHTYASTERLNQDATIAGVRVGVPAEIEVVGTAAADGTYSLFSGMAADRPHWGTGETEGFFVRAVTGATNGWQLYESEIVGEDLVTTVLAFVASSDSAYLPPKTGWTGSDPPTLAYDIPHFPLASDTVAAVGGTASGLTVLDGLIWYDPGLQTNVIMSVSNLVITLRGTP